jgi:hypothetical protein
MFNVVYRFFSNVCTVISLKPAIGRKNGHRLGWLPLDEEYNGIGPEWICHGRSRRINNKVMRWDDELDGDEEIRWTEMKWVRDEVGWR